jgi:hypothetical protein
MSAYSFQEKNPTGHERGFNVCLKNLEESKMSDRNRIENELKTN